MENISGHDAYKTASPYEDVNQDVIDIMERSLLHCPFCLAQPFFEDSAKSSDIFISCNCGARMRGLDYDDVTARWSKRPSLPVTVKKQHWTGW